MNHARAIDKDTTLCISLAARPSNHGTRFHNYLYNELGLNFVYKAFSTTDLRAAIAGLRGLGIRGCAISMPFKEAVIELVDEMRPSAAAIDSVNTIVNDSGILRAYNTDYQAVYDLLGDTPVSEAAVAGSGGMAKAVVAALRDAGFADVTIVARNGEAGQALADRYGFRWQAELGELRPSVLVNATPIGMAGGDSASALPFPESALEAASVAFDVVARPIDTPFVRSARTLGLTVIDGGQVIAGQAAEQFELYTGVRPSAEQVRAASEYARAGAG
ncbi:shikimate 5-dehydrogenase [Skermania sp. ID1734]|uniref:shikimate 5-dehydrogenase n=1 Tax=Skermania sp. ID1734 TaxID=2597516 RepID=UPI001181348B|nr:shikimate 5-dehydrogenase [Skermania sp. ID1734]TSD93927.1 shikimate 5-dehydrogenase [Skermania sp. ID1734]